MQSIQQLSTLSTEEGARQRAMEATRGAKEKEGDVKRDLVYQVGTNYIPAPPLMPREEWEARQRQRAAPPVTGPFIHPLPTIETIMTYAPLTRPTYDSIARGEAPAQIYNTVIHTPKPPSLRPNSPPAKSPLEQILTRAAELRDERISGARTRSDTDSSLGSLMTTRSYDGSESSFGCEGEDGGGIFPIEIEVCEPEPPSPAASTSSTSRATASSSPPRSPLSPVFPTTQLANENASGRSSPTGSFRSSVSTLSSLYDSYSSNSFRPGSSHSARPSSNTSSPAQSPPSSAYPSPPASPQLSRRSSSSEEWMAHPSPPTSPFVGPAQGGKEKGEAEGRRRSASFPPPPTEFSSLSSHPTITDPNPTRLRASTLPLTSQPPILSSSISLSSFPPFSPLDLPLEEDDEGEDDEMDWSMNGGEIIYGAAGVAVNPRAMRSGCCHCECKGLGLYVIDEEPENVVESVEVGVTPGSVAV